MRRYWLALMAGSFFMAVTAPAWAQMSRDEALTEFVAAGMAYKEGRYEAAIERYTKVLEGGRVSGPLLYNLGNSYFKTGETGKAVLYYERAKRFIPRDSDLNFNDQYALSKMDQYGNGHEPNLIERAARAHIDFYTVEEMAIVLVVTVVAAGFLFLLSLYVKWPANRSASMFAVLGVIIFVYGAGLVIKVQDERGQAVIMQDTESYFEPRGDSTVHFKLPEGMKVKIIKDEPLWLKVRRQDGKIGWVERDLLERI